MPGLRVPGFLAPPPAVPVPDLAAEPAGLRATPPDAVRAGLPDDPALAALRADPEAGLELLCAQVRTYFDAAAGALLAEDPRPAGRRRPAPGPAAGRTGHPGVDHRTRRAHRAHRGARSPSS